MNYKFLLFPLFAFFAACSNAEVEVSTGVESGALSNSHEGEQLLVTITEISVHVANTNNSDDPCEDPERAEECDNSFIPLFQGEQQIDLLASSELSSMVEPTAIPAGKITQIRLILSEASWSNGGFTLPVLCSSCDESGLKLVTSGNLELQEGELLSLGLLFDSELSLRFSASEARLDPVVRLQADIKGK